MKQEILTNLDMGLNVIIDWYAHSGVAYSAAKPRFNISWCKNPDMVCFLNVPEEIARQRPNFGEERCEIEDFHREVGKNFLAMFDSEWVEFLQMDPKI
jgi:dTMP kinase